MDPDITRNFHRGNAESMAAHASTPAAERRKQRARVLAFIASQGQSGATSDEAELALSLPHQACSARFTELKKDALIVPAGQRVTRSGRKARVWMDRNVAEHARICSLPFGHTGGHWWEEELNRIVPVVFGGKQVGTARATWDGKGVQTRIEWDDDRLYDEHHPLDALEDEP